MFEQVKKSAYLEINLDDLTHNVKTIRANSKNPKVGIIGVVKSGAYGHGSVEIAKHLKSISVERLATTTLDEAINLRRHGIQGPIHVFENIQSWEVTQCLEYKLLATVGCKNTIINYASALQRYRQNKCSRFDNDCFNCVNIKVDTGLSRYGCQPDELKTLVQLCIKNDINIDGIYSHFAKSDTDIEFSQKQLDIFLEATVPYTNMGINLHISNSSACMNGIGTDLDFVRPGMALYGVPSLDSYPLFYKLGIIPVCSMKATPTFVKKLPAGRKVSYNSVYETQGKYSNILNNNIHKKNVMHSKLVITRLNNISRYSF